MIPTIKPLLALTASDLMSPAVVIIPERMSLRGAARLLAHAHVTGAPVVNDEGRCVGVLSATDFVRLAEHEHPTFGACHTSEEPVCDSQILDSMELPEATVSRMMTHDVVTTPLSATVGELSRKMLDAHIHRIIVVDEKGSPQGVVSSTDVLAALVRAGDARQRADEHVELERSFVS